MIYKSALDKMYIFDIIETVQFRTVQFRTGERI